GAHIDSAMDDGDPHSHHRRSYPRDSGRRADLVLNLGAGLDTRPYRMQLPSNLTWVEADRASIIHLKESRLFEEKPFCKLERVSCDLTDDSAREAGQVIATLHVSG